MQHDFRYISKKDPQVRAAYENLMELLAEVHRDLKKDYTFQHKIVGSYSRNMITYDAKSNIGFDFDINIYSNEDSDSYGAKDVKLLFKKALDRHCKAYGFDYAEDSTRVLTIKVKDRSRSRIVYSVDFAFVNDYVDDNGEDRQEYIRFNKKQNYYSWEKQSQGYYMLPDKIEWIKEQDLWESDLKPRYIEKKNENSDPDLHSRTIFANTVHEICMKYGYCDE